MCSAASPHWILSTADAVTGPGREDISQYTGSAYWDALASNKFYYDDYSP